MHICIYIDIYIYKYICILYTYINIWVESLRKITFDE